MKDNETTIIDPMQEESQEHPELIALYAELGKAYYQYRFEEPTPELIDCFDRITAFLKQQEAESKYILEMEKPARKERRIPKIRGNANSKERICPQCKSRVEKGDVFCGECGKKL